MSDDIKVEDNSAGVIGDIIGGATKTSRPGYKATITKSDGTKKIGEGNTKADAVKNAYDG